MNSQDIPPSSSEGNSQPELNINMENEVVAPVSPNDFLQEIIANPKAPLNWYEQLMEFPQKIDAFLENPTKNRFPSALLYDKTRVVIKRKDKEFSDYYHASFVDSYEKPAAYILAQAPFNEVTEADFYTMCLQQKPAIILLLSSMRDKRHVPKMKLFWPNTKHERQYDNGMRVRCSNFVEEGDIHLYDLNLLAPGVNPRDGFRVKLVQASKWMEDKDVPNDLFNLRAIMKICLARREGFDDEPIMMVCSSGIHCCGTFAALNIIIDRITAEKRVGLDETITVLKQQRYGCFSFFEHYKILHYLIRNFIVTSGLVNANAIGQSKSATNV